MTAAVLLRAARGFAARPGESEDVAFERVLILIVALACCACGLVWSAMYWVVFGIGPTMALPLVFVAVVGAALLLSAAIRDHRPAVYADLVCITWVSAFIQWTIGGAAESGLVIAWSFLGPIGALIFLSLRQAVVWLGMFLLIVLISAVVDPALLGAPLVVSPAVRAMFLTMHVGVSLSVTFAAAAWFVASMKQERARSDRLVAEMLPPSIARRLKDGVRTIADGHPAVTVLFADIAGFTDYSALVTPAALVDELNAVFERFDQLARTHGIEKIKTIGDAYMAVCGAPEPNSDHAVVMARFALALQAAAGGILRADGQPFRLRVGLHSGAAVGGVIGSSKRAFDLWGDSQHRQPDGESRRGRPRTRLRGDGGAARRQFSAGGSRRGQGEGQGRDALVLLGIAKDAPILLRGSEAKTSKSPGAPVDQVALPISTRPSCTGVFGSYAPPGAVAVRDVRRTTDARRSPGSDLPARVEGHRHQEAHRPRLAAHPGVEAEGLPGRVSGELEPVGADRALAARRDRAVAWHRAHARHHVPLLRGLQQLVQRDVVQRGLDRRAERVATGDDDVHRGRAGVHELQLGDQHPVLHLQVPLRAERERRRRLSLGQDLAEVGGGLGERGARGGEEERGEGEGTSGHGSSGVRMRTVDAR